MINTHDVVELIRRHVGPIQRSIMETEKKSIQRDNEIYRDLATRLDGINDGEQDNDQELDPVEMENQTERLSELESQVEDLADVVGLLKNKMSGAFEQQSLQRDGQIPPWTKRIMSLEVLMAQKVKGEFEERIKRLEQRFAPLNSYAGRSGCV